MFPKHSELEFPVWKTDVGLEKHEAQGEVVREPDRRFQAQVGLVFGRKQGAVT
jgi:hypothetical protein